MRFRGLIFGAGYLSATAPVLSSAVVNKGAIRSIKVTTMSAAASSTSVSSAAPFSPAIEKLRDPPVSVVKDWKTSYDGRKGVMIDMSQAVPGYPAHSSILSALSKAGGELDSARYGRCEGDDDLRMVYASHVSDVYGASVQKDEVLITSGCNQAFTAAALLIAGHGDDILMPLPAYFNHDSTLDMLGIGVRFFKCHKENQMVPQLKDIEAAIGPNTKAISLVSPNNPCGTIYPADLLDNIFEMCQQRKIWLILDETYRDFLPLHLDRPHNLLNRPGWQNNLIQLYSFSKSYCIPGHRLGAIVAGAPAVKQLVKFIDNVQICAPRAPQMVVASLLNEMKDWRDENRVRIAERSDLFVKVMKDIEGFEVCGYGSYFGYVRHPFAGIGSAKVAQALAEKVGVLTIPGEFFGEGQEDYLRFALANADKDVIAQLSDRLNGLKAEHLF